MKHYLQKMVYIILIFESLGNNLTLLYLTLKKYSELCRILKILHNVLLQQINKRN